MTLADPTRKYEAMKEDVTDIIADTVMNFQKGTIDAQINLIDRETIKEAVEAGTIEGTLEIPYKILTPVRIMAATHGVNVLTTPEEKIIVQ